MKRFALISIGIILVLSMVLTSTGSAIAAPLGGGPTISAPSGGGTVTLTVVPVSKLPGTEMNDVGTIFPVGHTNGDMMFSGNGVQVSGLVGYATLSMPLANYTSGWSGSIYQWMNESWVALPTTITANEEGPDATASATIYSNGTFALITGFKLPDTAGTKDCGYWFIMLDGMWDEPDGISFFGGVIYGPFGSQRSPVSEGTRYRYKVISLDPTVQFTGDVSGYVVVVDSWAGKEAIGIEFVIPDGAYVSHDADWSYPPFIFRVFIDGCKVDYIVDDVG